MATPSDNSGWLDTFQDFIGGSLDTIMEYGLPDWLDFDTPATAGTPNNQPTPQDISWLAPYMVAAGNGQSVAAGGGMSPNMRNLLIVGAGAALVAGVIVLVAN